MVDAIACAIIDGRVREGDEVKIDVDEDGSGLDPVFGARPLKRLIQREVVDAIACAIIDGRVREGDEVKIDVDEDGSFVVV